MIALRGLPATQRLEPTILDEAQLRVRIEAQFRAENPPEEIAASQATLVAMGLLPAGTSLGDLYVNLLGSQVAGYYDPATKQIYVVARTGQIGAIEKVTFAHEFTHALQDQNFGLKGIQTDAIGQGDRSIAHLALIEGDASLLMTQWLAGPPRCGRDRGDPGGRSGGPGAAGRDAAVPPRRAALPVPAGADLRAARSGRRAAGRPSTASLRGCRTPPSRSSTRTRTRPTSSPVAVPLDAAAIAGRLGAGWKATPADTLGEFQIGSWLRARGVTGADGSVSGDAAAAGWGGDRYALIDGPDGAYALVILTTWDTPARRDRVRHGSHRGDPRRPRPGACGHDRARHGSDPPGGVAVLFASDATTLATLATAALP